MKTCWLKTYIPSDVRRHMSFRRSLVSRIIIAAVGLVTLAFGLSIGSTATETTPPALVRWVSPSFTSVLLPFDAAGRLVFEIEIDSAGEVVSVKGIEGHPQLIAVTESAIWQWNFAPATERSRTFRLAFEYHKILESMEGPTVLPYGIKVPISRPVAVDTVPADWIPGSVKCELHGDSLIRGRVAIRYGMTWPRKIDLDAKVNFPQANSSYGNGCLMLIDEATKEFSPKNADVLCCPTCRTLADQWFREHPIKSVP